MATKIPKKPEERFFSKVQPAPPDSCWVWTGALSSGGYGVFQRGSSRATARTILAHVWAYEFFVGTKPAGLDLDHLCRNRACVNPAHLEPVTRSVNLSRGDMRRPSLKRAASGRLLPKAVSV